MEDTDLYKNYIDKKILIKYCGDSYVTGACRSIDGYMNIVIEDAKYYETPDADAVSLISCFVKGGSLKHIELADNETQ